MIPFASRRCAFAAGALAVSVLAAGCVLQAGREPILNAYVKDPFAPINLFVNPNEHVDAGRGELLEHLALQLENSGAFIRVDRGLQRWPSTLQLRYRWEYSAEPSDYLARAGSWLTLGLVPMKVGKTHTLTADVFLEPEPVATLTYTEAAGDWVSLYTLGDPNAGERAVINRLLERMVSDLAARKLVPRARAVTDPPEPSRKRRKQPVSLPV